MRVGVPRTRRSKAVAGAFLVLAMAAGAGGWLLRPEAEAVAASTTQAVATSTLKETVTATGTLRAARSEAMSFAVGGTVRAVLVREGDQVKKGAALARVDTTSLVAARTAARSSYDAALAQLDEDVDDGASDVQVAADRSSVVVARSSWVEARDAVDDAVLRAPMAGTVVGLDLAVGDTVGAGTTAGDTSGGSACRRGHGQHRDDDHLRLRGRGEHRDHAMVRRGRRGRRRRHRGRRARPPGGTHRERGRRDRLRHGSDGRRRCGDERQRLGRLPGRRRGHRQASGPVRRRPADRLDRRLPNPRRGHRGDQPCRPRTARRT